MAETERDIAVWAAQKATEAREEVGHLRARTSTLLAALKKAQQALHEASDGEGEFGCSHPISCGKARHDIAAAERESMALNARLIKTVPESRTRS